MFGFITNTLRDSVVGDTLRDITGTNSPTNSNVTTAYVAPNEVNNSGTTQLPVYQQKKIGYNRRQGKDITVDTLDPKAPGNANYIDPAQAVDDPRTVLSSILRGEWSRYEQTFQPLKNQLESATTYNGNPGILPELLKQGESDVNNSYNGTVEMQTRAMQGMGMAPTDREMSALTKSTNLARGLSQVGMANQAEQTQLDLNRQVAGGMPTAKNAAMSLGQGGY